MKKTFALLAVCLITIVSAFVLQAAPEQSSDQYLPFVAGSGVTLPVALGLETIVDAGGLERPVAIVHAGDERLFIVERAGTIRLVESDGTVRSTPFLDITDRVQWLTNPEQGLLGLAFHPDYASNGTFFVNYTAKPDGDTHISRFQVSADTNIAVASSETLILTVDQPAGNHNGGDLAFGPADGYLYVALGDGGSSNDPGDRAQSTQELLGKLLRLDVDGKPGNRPPDCGDGPYHVPSDNPLVGETGACDEIWALGLRNPWRFSFDAETQEIYIADVGQSTWEEVNVRPVAGGENYGWRCYEGTHPNVITGCLPASAYTMPVFEYNHDEGRCSVTGGFVYRGQRYPALVGHYLFTDYCSGTFWMMQRDGNTNWTVSVHDNLERAGYASFGEGVDGELYVVNVVTGELFHVVETNTGAQP